VNETGANDPPVGHPETTETAQDTGRRPSVRLLPTLRMHLEMSVSDFVRFWSRLYDYGNEAYYFSNIFAHQFTKEQLWQLLEWKNGMVLSEAKKKTLKEKVLGHLEVINQMKAADKWNEGLFDRTFYDLGVSWRIFMRHVIKPDRFPDFDYHTYHAYRFIAGLKVKTVSKNAQLKESFYLEKYLPFVHELVSYSSRPDRRKLDEALAAFGKFLDANPGMFSNERLRTWN